jgi:hypothetical protein
MERNTGILALLSPELLFEVVAEDCCVGSKGRGGPGGGGRIKLAGVLYVTGTPPSPPELLFEVVAEAGKRWGVGTGIII